MNLPNKLTIIRMVMVPVFVITLMLTRVQSLENVSTALFIISAIIFAASALTDMADGKIARKYNLITNFGKFMDPLADKFMVIGALFAAIYVYDAIRLELVITTLIIVFRELAVTGMRLVVVNADNIVVPAAMAGKIKTFSQCILIELIILEPMFTFSDFLTSYLPLTRICMLVVVFFTLYSGYQYMKAYGKYIKI